ncbi:MAG TPA: TetR/AcrR family transcriptional regulator [Rubrobacteraceae bacterium]|nr:TetR/AcrR family transcriptional regulator [Rubrobacteraceae bacterium]
MVEKRSTKERVLGAAVRLFNEKGTAAISTNHIAEEAGISPGNLYYHYRNKDEIIREIFERVDAYWGEAYSLPTDGASTLGDMRAMVEETFAGLWEYRFFYRELAALTLRDPGLRERYLKVRDRGLSGTEALLRGFVEAGVLREPEDEAAIPELAKTLMLIAEHWLPFADAGGEELGPDRVREGAALMMRVLRPRLTEQALAGLAPKTRR